MSMLPRTMVSLHSTWLHAKAVRMLLEARADVKPFIQPIHVCK